MSDFSVPVVRIAEVRKHGNADTLSITNILGEDVIFKNGEYLAGDLAIYVPVDAVVPPSVPGTEFLGDSSRGRRIKAKKLRGVYSEGLLLPLFTLRGQVVLPPHNGNGCGEDLVGLDVADKLGIIKYEDSVPAMLGGGPRKHGINPEILPTPKDVPEYNVEQYKRNRWKLQPGDRVVITEKLHGTQARYLMRDGKLHVGSHRVFWKDDQRPWARVRNWWRKLTKESPFPTNLYWKVAREEELAELADEETGLNRYVFYGEIYGDVQDLKYDHSPGSANLRVFDIYDQCLRRFLPWDVVVDICERIGLETVPVLYDGLFNETVLGSLVEGKSTLAPKQIREGVVIKKALEPEVRLKWVSQAYKLRKDGTELH